MQQLWLNHKRIDSITQLRTLFAAARETDEFSDTLCLRLLEYARSGVLAAWLARQSESTGVGLDPEAAKLASSIRTLQGCVQEDAALHQALSDLTGVPAACFAAEHVQKLQSSAQKEKSKKLAQLKQQQWWSQYEKTFALVKEHDWPLVALDSSQLQMALDVLRDDSTVHRTLYICGTEQMRQKWFVLNLKNIENVTIVGIGNPRVQYDRFNEDERIPVKKKRIFLQDLRVWFHNKVCLDEFKEYSANFRVDKR